MPSIIPALPSRPAVNRTTTLTQTDGVINVAAGTSESGFNVIPLVSLYYGLSGLRLQFSNAGTIWSEGAFAGITAVQSSGDMFDATNSGTIVAHNTYNDPFFAPQANAFAVTASNSTLNNSGQIFAIADFGRATAISVGDTFFKLDNSGLIAAQASIIDTAIGVSLNNGLFSASDGRAGAFLNRAGGQILAEGGIAYGVLASYLVSNLVNNGRIEAASTNPNGVSYGVVVSFMSSQFQPTAPLSTITNAGTIKGDYSIWATGFNNSSNLPGTYVQSILNQAGGQLIGTVFTGNGADRVINAGTIDGAIILNQGNDLFDTSTGTVHGVVDMGWDQDHYIGSAGDDDVLGGRNADLIEGNGGDDLLIGEQGNDTIIGGAGNDGIYGGSGEDTITTQGGDWVHGGDGNDTIVAGDLTFERIDGGLGTDTLTLPGTGNLLDLAGAFADGRLESIEQINLSAGQQILLRSNTGFAGFGSEIVLAGNASNAVTLAGTFNEAAQVVRGGQTYRTFTSGGMSILVDSDTQITVQSKVTNPGGGLAAIAGGALAPLAIPDGPYRLYDGTWSTDITYSLRVSLLVDADETIVKSAGGGALFETNPLGFGFAAGVKIENHGTLLAGSSSAARGSVTYGHMPVENYGTMIAEANTKDGYALTILGPVNYNSGLIAARGGWGSVAVQFDFEFGSLANQGRIEATGFSSSGTAVFMSNSSPVENHGRIVALGGGNAVAVQGTQGTLVNTDTISATSNSIVLDDHGMYKDKGTAFGIYGVQQINNSGLIEAISTTGIAIGVEGTAANAIFNRGRYFYNTGEIVAKGIAPTNFGFAQGLQVAAIGLRIGGGDVINDGTIRAEVLSGAALDMKSIGMWVAQNPDYFPGITGVTNNGTISADIAIRFFGNTSPNTFSTLDFFVTNNGTINGDIWFANGNDQYSAAAGRTNGLVYGFGGNDSFTGGAFADWFEGGDGNDTLIGGGGADRASYSQALGSVTVDLRVSTAQNTGGAGIDTLVSIEELVGSDFADSLIGNADANYLAGGGGDDVLTGLGGNDTFDGGTGINDEARYAGNRADYLIENVLIGGLDYVRITGLGGAAGDGVDLLRNVEFAQFADQRVAIAPPRPSLGTPAMPDQNVGDSIPYIFQIPAGSFVDPDLSTPLGFAATLADGSPLPGWLSFNPNTRTFTGTAPFALIGTVLQVKVTATDSDPNHPGESVSDIFALTIVASSPYQVGTSGPDTLIGTSASERLFGNDGDDTFIGSAGSDTIVGGNGVDLVDYSNWILNIEVNLTNGTARKNDFDPFWGIVDAGTDALSGVEGVRGTAFSDTLFGSSNNDAFWGGDGNDGITGMDGDDRLFGEAGDDVLVGWNGDDWLDGGTGADSMDGGEGNDTFVVDNVGDRVSDFGGGIDTVRTSLSTYALSFGIENLIYTGTGASTLTGNDLDNLIYGGIGADAMYGSSGNDTYVVNDPGDTVFESANDGIDTVQSSINVYVLPDEVENLQFTGTGNASLTGNLLANVISGGSGNDILSGQGGIDNLSGLTGNDRLVVTAAGSGSFVDGGANFDTLAVSGAVSLGGIAGIEAIELTAGANLTLTTSQLMAGLAPNTQLSGSGTITINLEANVFAAMTGFQGLGAPINFLLIGSAGDDYIKASHFANTINGGAGRDFVRGGNGIDTIDGGTEADKITGWGGADILTGGSGNDQFRYLYATDSGVGAAADRITDFTIGGDVIDLRLLDRDLVTPDIQSYSLSFIGSAAFGGTGASQIRYTTSGANMLVQFDLDGNGSSDMEIILQGLAGQTLSTSDFLFASAGAEPLPAVKEAAPAVMEPIPPAGEPLVAVTFDDTLSFEDHGLIRWLPVHSDLMSLV